MSDRASAAVAAVLGGTGLFVGRGQVLPGTVLGAAWAWFNSEGTSAFRLALTIPG